MGNPIWQGYTETPPQNNSIWAGYGAAQTPEPTDDGGMQQRIINRVRNIGSIVGTGYDILTNQINPKDAQVVNVFKQGYEQGKLGGRVANDFANTFAKTDPVETLKSVLRGVGDIASRPFTDPVGAAKGLAMMIPSVISSVVGDTFGAVTGVRLDGNTVKTMDVDEQANVTKSFIANSVAAIVAPAASKALGLLTEGVGAGLAADASTQSVAQAAVTAPRVGAIGRAIIDDVGAAAASGMVQGALANSNTPEALSSMATGLLFAPIGVLTGWYRGVKNPIGLPEVRQMNAVVELSRRNASAVADANLIGDLRNWQDVSGLSVDQVAGKVEKLLTVDDIKQAAHVPEGVVPNVDHLYDEFKKDYKEGSSFASAIVDFTEKHNLQPHTNEIFEKFATKRVAEGVPEGELSNLKSLVKQNREANNGSFLDATNKLVQAANERGMFFTDNFGSLQIHDAETGDILLSANNSKEALDYLEKFGSTPNPVGHDALFNVSSGVEGPPTTPIAHPHATSDFQPLKTNRQDRVAQFDLSSMMKPFTAMNAFVERIDTRHGTNFKHLVFEPLEEAGRKLQQAVRESSESGTVRLIDSFVRSGKNKYGYASRFAPEDLEQVSLYREAQSWDELVAPGGYGAGITAAPEAQSLAKFMHENGVNASNVLYYRRAMAGIKGQFIQAAKVTAQAEHDFNVTQGMDAQMAHDLYKQTLDNYDKNPAYIAQQQLIASRFNPDATFMKAVQGYDKLFEMPNGPAQAGVTSRLKLALEKPETHGVTRDEFAKIHNLSSDQLRLGKMLDDAYEQFGKKFGIDDSRLLMRYMNHFRQFGDIIDSYVVGDFERGIMDGGMRQFASTMIRTGEIANYSLDPIGNLYSYIRSGHKSQILYPALEDAINKTDSAIGGELKKISDPVVQGMVKERFNNYQRDISGQMSLSDTEAMHIRAQYLKNIELKDETGTRKMTTEEIIKDLQKPDYVDTMMALSSSGLLGGRVTLALRDAMDVYQKYYIKYGVGRLGTLLRTKVSSADIDRLVENGTITKPDPLDLYNVTRSRGPTGVVGGVAKELAEFGFKTSLQGQMYLKNQAAVYIDAVKNVNKVYKELVAKDLSGDEFRSQLHDKLFLNSQDAATQRMFHAYIADGQVEAAAQFLAKQDVRQLVGTFSRGNQAPILNSKPGKMFGQMGSWGMTNRSVFEDLMSRGTDHEVSRSRVRFATTIGAGAVASATLGLNVGTWMLLPTSFIQAGGGPVLSFVNAGSQLVSGMASGDPNIMNYTNRAFATAAEQFIPGHNAVRDVKRAAQLTNPGVGFGIMRPALQAAGVQVNEKGNTVYDFDGTKRQTRTMLDVVMGNYPMP